MRFLHLLPIVGNSAPEELLLAQELTLRSIEVARKFSSTIDVDVVGSRFFDEATPVDWMIDYPCLSTSFSDICGIDDGPRLPLLREVFLPLQDLTGYDYVIFSNIDIGIQPFFYDAIKRWTLEGLDAINITRRNIDMKIQEASLVKAYSANGKAHPGSDCFVFTPKSANRFIFGNVAMGLIPVDKTLALNLFSHAKAYRKLFNQHVSFHIGLDSDWMTNPNKLKMRQHNEEEFAKVLREITDTFVFEGREVLLQSPQAVLKTLYLLGWDKFKD